MLEDYWEKYVATRRWVTIMFSTIGLQLSCNERLIERFRLQARYVTYGSSISCQNRNGIAVTRRWLTTIVLDTVLYRRGIIFPRSILGAQQFRRRLRKIAVRRHHRASCNSSNAGRCSNSTSRVTYSLLRLLNLSHMFETRALYSQC